MFVTHCSRPRAWLFILALLPAVQALADPAGLTLDEALRLAVQRSAATSAAQAGTQASTEAAAQAGQLPDPMLRLGVDNLPIEGPDRWSLTRDFMTMRRIGIEQEWVSADKRAARSERAGRMVALQEAEVLARAAEVRRQTAEAWIEMWHAQHELGFAARLAQHSADDLAAVQAAHRAGKASAGDVAQARLALLRAQDASHRARQARDTARLTLQRWVQASVDAVDDKLPLQPVPADRLEDARLASHHPSLLRAQQARQLAEADVTVAATERRPDWRYELAYSQRSAPYGDMLSFGVTIPLTVNRAQRQDRNLAEKAAQATAARLEYDDMQRTIATEFAVLQARMDSLLLRAAELQRDALPLAQQAVDLAVAAYRAGSGRLSDIFSARRMLVEQQQQIAELERDAAFAWAQLSLPLETRAPTPEKTP